MRISHWLQRTLIALAMLLALPSWGATDLNLNGAGATFPYPLYSKWFYNYNQLKPEIKFNYQSIGSGGGIKQVLAGTVDFGASDAPMNQTDLVKAETPILHIPTVLGAVVVTYNVPGIRGAQHLQLTGPVVAEIFMGKITKWNDPKIAALNTGVTLPDQAILPAYRSDGSGTTYIFTEYLAKVSPEWKSAVGAEKSVKWPVGLGAKGNEGVSGIVKSTPGSIGYVELAYAVQNKLSYASIQNKSGKFITPTIESVTAAAAGEAAKMPKDYRMSLTDAAGENSYPISSFTYLLVYKNAKDAEKGKALVDFLNWAVEDGQKVAPQLHYAPLPAEVVARIKETIKTIRVAK